MFFIAIFVIRFHLNMINRDEILRVLDTVVHPETGYGLVEGKFVGEATFSDGKISVILKFPRHREPFATSLSRHASEALSDTFPDTEISVAVETPKPSIEPSRRLPGIGNIVAVASGKGGVGKSTVTANLALTLAAQGFRVGVLDADIYGPSQPSLFGVDDYLPPTETDSPDSAIVPAESHGVKVMSIGFFINSRDALVWRGPMATNALRQLVRQTAWGDLDYLIIDLPPGTGDVHLNVAHELAIDGAVIVSTPGTLAITDVRRGIGMFCSEGIDIQVLGIVENMAWFSPAEMPENRYYIFGNGDTKRFAAEEGIEFLGEIPLVLTAGQSSEPLATLNGVGSKVAPYYVNIAIRIVDKLSDGCLHRVL